MSRRDSFDVVVVGAGIVGASAALLAAQHGQRVALIEARAPRRWSPDAPDLRVVAFAPDNAALLDALGVWPAIESARVQPYRRMEVWDAGDAARLHFAARDQGRQELGWIIENDLLVDRLWSALQAQPAITRHCPATLMAIEQGEDEIQITLDDQRSLRARLLLVADGAASPTRQALGIDVDLHDYAQQGLVAYVDTTEPHAETCYQRFLPGGPLAFLPFADGRSSIVWSLPNADADRLLAVSEAEFLRELERAFDGRLGALTGVSARRAYPLRRQLARGYAQGRALLLGYAAHVVHPLAGQGVNLGLRDVAACARLLTAGNDPGAERALQRLARERRSDNAVAAYAFDGIQKVFSNEAVLPTLLRGPLLGLADRLAPLKSLLMRRALGAG